MAGIMPHPTPTFMHSCLGPKPFFWKAEVWRQQAFAWRPCLKSPTRETFYHSLSPAQVGEAHACCLEVSQVIYTHSQTVTLLGHGHYRGAWVSWKGAGRPHSPTLVHLEPEEVVASYLSPGQPKPYRWDSPKLQTGYRCAENTDISPPWSRVQMKKFPSLHIRAQAPF